MNNTLRCLIYDNQVSLTLINTTDIVQTAIKLHTLSPSSAIILGKALSSMTFMSACLKEQTGEISLSLNTDGECGDIGISGIHDLNIRGYIQNPKADISERLCFGSNGSFTIIRDDGYNRPFVGSSGLTFNGTMDEAFEEYYRISEQLPTRLYTDVQLDDKGNCIFAGIVAMQPLPFAEEKTVDQVNGYPLQNILERLKTSSLENSVLSFFDKSDTVWEMRKAQYRCNCSKTYLSRVLITLGKPSLKRIIEEDGQISVHCHYCNKDYIFLNEDIDRLFS